MLDRSGFLQLPNYASLQVGILEDSLMPLSAWESDQLSRESCLVPPGYKPTRLLS